MQAVKPVARCKLRRVWDPSHPGRPLRFLRNEVADYQGAFEPGDLLYVEDAQGQCLGVGFVNPFTRIAVRMLTWGQEVQVDPGFFEKRLAQAYALRQARTSLPEALRIVSGEIDGLPGVRVDRYGDYLGVQILIQGMERLRPLLLEALKAQFQPEGIYEHSSGPLRESEGLAPKRGILEGDVPERLPVRLNGVSYVVDTLQGQETGLYLDQRDNYGAIRRYLEPGAKVLDAFCYTGGFALVAAQQGCAVLGIDASSRAIEVAQQAAALQQNGSIQWVQDTLPQALSSLEPRSFDVVIVDPPSVTQPKHSLRNVWRSHTQLLRQAIPLLRSDGILISTLRSPLVNSEQYLDLLASVGVALGRPMTFLEVLGQPWDFPWLACEPTQRYLTCVVSRVL